MLVRRQRDDAGGRGDDVARDVGALAAHVGAFAGGDPHPDPIVLSALSTPIGPMVSGATGDGVCLLEFSGRRAVPAELAELVRRLERPVAAAGEHGPGSAVLEQLGAELAAYFAGSIREFAVPLVMPGTPFEREVWAALLKIPYGTTCSYGEMAERLGRPGAQRAVGRANGRNRIAIVVPCHRVIEATGALRGYGGGLARKKFLLEHERDAASPGLFG